MSIDIISRVWRTSPHKGNALLCQLAMADNADRDGVCWPGKAYLQERIRADSHRTVDTVVDLLQSSGEVFYRRGGGRGKRSLYLVTTELNEGQLIDVLMRRFGIPKKDAEIASFSIVAKRGKFLQEKGANFAQKGANFSEDNEPVLLEPVKEKQAKSKKTTVSKKRHIETSTITADKPQASSKKKRSSTRKPWSDLTDALHNATPQDIRSSRPHYAAANEAAKTLYEAGFTPDQIKAYADENYPGYRTWAEECGKSPVMSMQHVERKIRGWKPKPVYDPDPYTYIEIIEDGIPVRYISGRKEVTNHAA